jgi:hypothetical protein
MKRIILILTLLLLFSLPSCAARKTPSCRDILGEIMLSEIGLPAGKVYSMSAPDGNDEHLPDTLIARLFGDGTTPSVASGWLDLALFLPSSSHPCEFAVILCDSEDTATDTARLLCRRLDAIRTVKGEGEFSSMIETATVTVIENFVLLIISSDTENAIKSASKIIG